MQAYLDREARDSLYTLLGQCHPGEVRNLLDQLRAGRVNKMRQDGCLIGIIAGGRGTDYREVGLSGLATWPMERWLSLVPGDTPQNHEQARLLETWLISWLDERTIEQEVVAQCQPTLS